jgi:hypothetical protein
MKKIRNIILTSIAITSIITAPSSSSAFAGRPDVIIDGTPLILDQPSMVVNNRIMVPLRKVFESLGATVLWDQNTQTVTGKKGGNSINLIIGDPSAIVNGNPITLDEPAEVVNGRTLVPIRIVSEALGANVQWDDNSRTVTILTSDHSTTSASITNDTNQTGANDQVIHYSLSQDGDISVDQHTIYVKVGQRIILQRDDQFTEPIDVHYGGGPTAILTDNFVATGSGTTYIRLTHFKKNDQNIIIGDSEQEINVIVD